MKKKEYIRLVVLFDKGDSALVDALKKVSKKYRLSVSAVASYSIQAGLPFVEVHFGKLLSKGEVKKTKS